MATAAEVAAHINNLLPNVPSGSLRFFGEWFGGRRDNLHVVVGSSATNDLLIVNFDGGEVLTLTRPEGVTINDETFLIEDAERVRWEWFYYGRPRRPENLYVIEYVRRDGGIEVADTTDWYEPEHSPNLASPAVEIG